MTTLALAAVCDLDCIASARPLVLDLPSVERYVTGGRAVCYRILYGWCAEAELLELEGTSWDGPTLAAFRTQLADLAEAEDYVQAVSVAVGLDADGALVIGAAIGMVDGRTYSLEITAAEAVSASFGAA